jgi:hypothetical protein
MIYTKHYWYRLNYISPRDAQRIYGVNRFTIIRWCQRNQLPFVRLGNGHLMIQRADLEDCIEARKQFFK